VSNNPYHGLSYFGRPSEKTFRLAAIVLMPLAVEFTVGWLAGFAGVPLWLTMAVIQSVAIWLIAKDSFHA
jgi:hypothetical protein